MITFSSAKGKKTLKIKAKLLEVIAPDALAAELFPDNEELQKLVSEKCAGTDTDEEETEEAAV